MWCFGRSTQIKHTFLNKRKNDVSPPSSCWLAVNRILFDKSATSGQLSALHLFRMKSLSCPRELFIPHMPLFAIFWKRGLQCLRNMHTKQQQKLRSIKFSIPKLHIYFESTCTWRCVYKLQVRAKSNCLKCFFFNFQLSLTSSSRFSVHQFAVKIWNGFSSIENSIKHW